MSFDQYLEWSESAQRAMIERNSIAFLVAIGCLLVWESARWVWRQFK